jgi:hypothetical protein
MASDVITDGSRLWQADMAAQTLKDLGIPFTPEQNDQIAHNEDLRDYLSTLDPFSDDEGPEWQRIADDMEYEANRSEWENALYEEEEMREQENFYALQEDRENFFAERDF